LRLLGSLAEAREVVKASFEVKRYEPRRSESWEPLYERFKGLLTG
jgi:hypothetical protein